MNIRKKRNVKQITPYLVIISHLLFVPTAPSENREWRHLLEA
jgi:hypothetical protein